MSNKEKFSKKLVYNEDSITSKVVDRISDVNRLNVLLENSIGYLFDTNNILGYDKKIEILKKELGFTDKEIDQLKESTNLLEI